MPSIAMAPAAIHGALGVVTGRPRTRGRSNGVSQGRASDYSRGVGPLNRDTKPGRRYRNNRKHENRKRRVGPLVSGRQGCRASTGDCEAPTGFLLRHLAGYHFIKGWTLVAGQRYGSAIVEPDCRRCLGRCHQRDLRKWYDEQRNEKSRDVRSNQRQLVLAQTNLVEPIRPWASTLGADWHHRPADFVGACGPRGEHTQSCGRHAGGVELHSVEEGHELQPQEHCSRDEPHEGEEREARVFRSSSEQDEDRRPQDDLKQPTQPGVA